MDAHSTSPSSFYALLGTAAAPVIVDVRRAPAFEAGDAMIACALGMGFAAPVPASLDPWALALSIAAMIAIFRFKAGKIPTLLACAVTGVALPLAGAV